MAKLKTPVMLAILDGFGLGNINDPTNAVVKANPQTFNMISEKFPHTKLQASGLAVGLPEGQMGNSEVGHLNIGAGRIVYQELTRITKEIKEGQFFEKPILVEAYNKAKEGKLHLLSLISDGGVHSHIDHVKALIKGAKEKGLTEVYIHALLDGRDVAPKSAHIYINELEAFMADIGIGKIATVGGRYYGMDRDKRWDRIEKAYQSMVDGIGETAQSATEAINKAYIAGLTDEFVLPTIVDSHGMINHGDVVIFCNFRPDRARQLTQAFTDVTFDGFKRKAGVLNTYFATMVLYEDGLPAHVIYEKETLKNTLGEVLAKGGYKQLRIAETEKYAHVTYFFNGGNETPNTDEERILVPSPKVATYDLQPEMSAPEVTDKVIAALKSKEYDMIILNFANPDMVGHTGVLEAAERAVLAVDTCLGRIVMEILEQGGDLLVTADHGNSEMMMDPTTGSPHTAHTTNPVPLVLVTTNHINDTIVEGRLCDIAPTMLDLAGIKQPAEMTGESLLRRKL